jgi:hypothetical protein
LAGTGTVAQFAYPRNTAYPCRVITGTHGYLAPTRAHHKLCIFLLTDPRFLGRAFRIFKVRNLVPVSRLRCPRVVSIFSLFPIISGKSPALHTGTQGSTHSWLATLSGRFTTLSLALMASRNYTANTNIETEQYIENWLQGSTNWTGSIAVSLQTLYYG